MRPLVPPYHGPFLVLSRTEKVITILGNNQKQNVSLDWVKLFYLPNPKMQAEGLLENICTDGSVEKSEEPLFVKFTVTVYKADGITSMDPGILAQVKKVFFAEAAELPDPYVQVFFGGLKGSTRKRKTTAPCWDQQMTFLLPFPIPSRPMVLQVREDEILANQVAGTAVIHLDKISNSDSGGFLPTFGPCYVYLRESKDMNEDEIAYRGRLLIAVSSEILDNPNLTKPYVIVEPAIPLPEGTCGYEVEFLLFACLRDAMMIDKKVAEKKKIRFSLQIGHVPDCSTTSKHAYPNRSDATLKSSLMNGSDNKESIQNYSDVGYCSAYVEPAITNKKYYHLPINESKQCIWLKFTWLDCRRRMYISNILEKIRHKLECSTHTLTEFMDMKDSSTQTDDVERTIKDLENSTSYFMMLLKDNWEMFSSKTQLDKERWKTHQINLERVLEATAVFGMTFDRAKTNVALEKLKYVLQELRRIEEDPQPALPDVVVWMEANQKRVGYSRIAARDVLYTANEVERGGQCGKIRSLFFRPLSKKKSGVILAKVDLYLWLGLQKHSRHCFGGIPQGFDFDFGGQEMGQTDIIPHVLNYYEKQVYQLKAHIYQARSLPCSDMSKFPNPVAQLLIADRCLSTQIRENSLNPIWNETLVFNGLVFYGDSNEINQFPPDVVIEIYNSTASGKSACLCRGIIPVLQNESGCESLPLLQWYDITSTDSDVPSQILAAFELISMHEGGDGGGDDDQFQDIGPVMEIPPSIRPRCSLHRIEILFWGLRELQRVHLRSIDGPMLEVECGGNVIQSSVIANYQKHSNFIKMIEIMDMDLPEREAYFPALIIRLQDCKSFGRRNVIASHIIHNLEKYIVRAHGEILERKFERSDSKIENDMGVRDVAINIESSDHYSFHDSYIIQRVIIPWTHSEARLDVNGEEEEEDWWSRYYISTGENQQRRKSEAILPRTSMKVKRMTGYQLHTSIDVPRHSRSRFSVFPDKRRTLGDLGLKPLSSENLDAKAFVVYPCELENIPQFGGFEEWLHSFELTRARMFAYLRGAEQTVAIFKGCFRIYELPLPHLVVDPILPVTNPEENLFSGLPENKPTKVLVRAYIVKAIDLAPSDITNTTDAYIAIEVGKQRVTDKENYISKQLNPVFGKCFEFVANFPRDSTVLIQVMDWDLMGGDDLIGETRIDLENRFYSRHRPTCGLARTYETSGPNAWRDVITPLEILTEMCEESGLGPPHVIGEDIRIANIVYDFRNHSQDGKASEQDMALFLLHRWEDISPGKYSLVPEHLETRTLYHPAKPGEPQGKLVMWLDMFPENTVPPTPRNISTRKPSGYELRVIIWNTEDVVLADDAFFTGEKMSDIYVKGWLTGKEDAQCTDVHYRSLTGEGNFNWRFVFPFNYLSVERKVVVMKKVSVFSWDETEFKLPPKLYLQVWDADHFKADDCLGELTLDLHRFPRGAKNAPQCRLEMLMDDDSVPQISLFKQRRVRGWWPVSAEAQNGDWELTGKLDAELQLLTKEEAEKAPVGLGRKEPDSLEEPKRPETSFANFLHPFKTFRYALWKHYKRKVIIVMVLIAVVLIIILFVYSVPGYVIKKIIGA